MWPRGPSYNQVHCNKHRWGPRLLDQFQTQYRLSVSTFRVSTDTIFQCAINDSRPQC